MGIFGVYLEGVTECADVLAMKCENKRGKYDFKCYVLSNRRLV